MLQVANRGILFKVYRGVPLTFSMTPLAARGCTVGNAGGCWTEIFSPPMSLRKSPKHPPEVPRCPTGCPSLSRQKSLIVPQEVPCCPAGSPLPAPLRTSALPQDTEAFACRRGALGSPVALPPASPGRRPVLPGAPACRKNLQVTIVFRLKTSLDVLAPRGLPLRRRCPPRPPSGICLVKQYRPAWVGTVKSYFSQET